MTTSAPPTVTNTADPWSVVGIQAQAVHDSTVYQVLPDDPPSKRYEVGVRFLEDGVPSRARSLIGEAIARGYDSSDVRFHWLLAMLSKRTYSELNREERDQLRHLQDTLDRYADDQWKRGLRVLCCLLDCVDKPDSDPIASLKELRTLELGQRVLILRHLDLFLTGHMKEALWVETRDVARGARLENGRLDRVWAYFYPSPSGPRTRKPRPISTGPSDLVAAMVAATFFSVAVGYLGWLMVVRENFLAILAYLVAVAAGCVAARSGLEWRYRVERLRAKDREYLGGWRVRRAPQGGFADRVDRMFDHYFAKYVPSGADRQTWLAHTAGIRNTLRDELVELYRESRVVDKQISWLVRYMVGDVRQRWEKGTLWDYQQRYRTRFVVKAACCLGFLVLVPASVSVIVTATGVEAVASAIATIAALLGGWIAATLWLRIILERRRITEEFHEYWRRRGDRDAAFQRWRRKLADTKPSEAEMETWLDCDRTMLLDEAMRHYQLAWRDLIAHAFLQSPATRYKRARVRRGPWRYSRYEIRLFLLTCDGVRVFSAELDFEGAKFRSRHRTNFRFDAVASVHVTKTNTFRQTLELMLINGPAMTVRITDPDPGDPESGEDPKTLSEVTLDAAGFSHALYILEGIAAEGKEWITHDRRFPDHPGGLTGVNDLLN